jgi:hypothetical protein
MAVGNSTTQAIKGAGALSELLDCIGATLPNGDPAGDHAAAKVLVDNELELRALLSWSLEHFESGSRGY